MWSRKHFCEISSGHPDIHIHSCCFLFAALRWVYYRFQSRPEPRMCILVYFLWHAAHNNLWLHELLTPPVSGCSFSCVLKWSISCGLHMQREYKHWKNERSQRFNFCSVFCGEWLCLSCLQRVILSWTSSHVLLFTKQCNLFSLYMFHGLFFIKAFHYTMTMYM